MASFKQRAKPEDWNTYFRELSALASRFAERANTEGVDRDATAAMSRVLFVLAAAAAQWGANWRTHTQVATVGWPHALGYILPEVDMPDNLAAFAVFIGPSAEAERHPLLKVKRAHSAISDEAGAVA